MSRKKKNTTLTAATLPLLRDDLVREFSAVARGELTDLQKKWFDHHPGALPHYDLSKAELWWVTPAMTKLVYVAAPDLPPQQILWDQLPSQSGILIWEGSLGLTVEDVIEYRDGEEIVAPREITGAFWALDKGGIGVGPIVKNPYAPLGAYAASWAQDRLTRYLVTTWLLASQPTVGRTYSQAASLRRAYAKHLDLPMTITTATLRTIARSTDESDEETVTGSSHDSYSHRFLVRGHWRDQACGPKRSMRKPTWVVPYIKGPEDKPLVVKDKVNLWRR